MYKRKKNARKRWYCHERRLIRPQQWDLWGWESAEVYDAGKHLLVGLGRTLTQEMVEEE